ncbi:MAG: hypothetical protein ABSA49_01485 [Rhizomicrobium sp.]|jgi:hypothetical protein
MRVQLLKIILGCGLGSALVAAVPAEAGVVISTKPTANMSCSAGVCTATAATAVLNVTDLENLVRSGKVTVSTGGATASDIVIASALTWASANSLTLDAYRSITVEGVVSAAGSGGLSILTNDGGTGGTLSFPLNGNIGFLGLTNALSINGASYKLEGNIASMASDIAANSSGNYALAAAYNATPDGVYATSPIETQFSGNFEGLGNSISHLQINDGTDIAVGLFAFIQGGHVSDLKVVNARVTAGSSAQSVGILAGGLNGDVNDSAEGTNFGGTISGAVTSGIVQVTSAGQAAVGGVVGLACNYGAKFPVALVIDSQSSADITANIGFAGGLIGDNCGGAAIETSFATGRVISGDGYAGGLVGFDIGLISDSYAAGNAKTGAESENGFRPPNAAGGLVGVNSGNSVQYSYATGTAMKGKRAYAGGFIGYGGGTDTDNYWDITTSANTSPSGQPDENNLATGLTTSQFQSGLPSGFSPTIWKEDQAINSGLPYLIDNPPPL